MPDGPHVHVLPPRTAIHRNGDVKLLRLEELADVGRVATKKTGARGRVWWVPVPAEEADALLDGNSDVSR